MSRYFIEDVKCGYDTCFDCCGPHTTVASAIKYKNDDGKTGWLYCIQPEGYDPIIALHDDDVYEEKKINQHGACSNIGIDISYRLWKEGFIQ
jgi:hypothetical protein